MTNGLLVLYADLSAKIKLLVQCLFIYYLPHISPFHDTTGTRQVDVGSYDLRERTVDDRQITNRNSSGHIKEEKEGTGLRRTWQPSWQVTNSNSTPHQSLTPPLHPGVVAPFIALSFRAVGQWSEARCNSQYRTHS